MNDKLKKYWWKMWNWHQNLLLGKILKSFFEKEIILEIKFEFYSWLAIENILALYNDHLKTNISN